MSALRPTLAVLAGMVTWAALVQGAAAGFIAAMPDAFAEDGTSRHTGLLLFFLALSVIASLAAGAVTARVAPASGMRPVTALAAIQLALGLFFQLSAWDAMPLWYHLPFLALLAPANLLGGAWALGRRRSRSEHALG